MLVPPPMISDTEDISILFTATSGIFLREPHGFDGIGQEFQA